MSVTALGVGGLGSIPGLVCLSDRGPHPRIPVYGPTFPVSNLEAKNGGSRRFLVHKPAPSKPLTGHLLQAELQVLAQKWNWPHCPVDSLRRHDCWDSLSLPSMQRGCA